MAEGPEPLIVPEDRAAPFPPPPPSIAKILHASAPTPLFSGHLGCPHTWPKGLGPLSFPKTPPPLPPPPFVLNSRALRMADEGLAAPFGRPSVVDEDRVGPFS